MPSLDPSQDTCPAPDRLTAQPAVWPAAAALAVLVVAAMVPLAQVGFADYDVVRLVLRNPNVQEMSAASLKTWLATWGPGGYAPLRDLTFAVDHRIWGPQVFGFAITNGLIHLANALLVFGLLLRMHGTSAGQRDVLWSAAAAGLFALHPLAVEPMAWLPGRTELLTALAALGCLHFHVAARGTELQPIPGNADGLKASSDDDADALRTRRAILCRAGAVACCVVACLTSAAGAVVFLWAAVWEALARPRPSLGKVMRGTWLLAVIGAAAVVLRLAGPGRTAVLWEPDVFSLDRLRLALGVYGLNLKAIFWPTDLGFLYSPVEARRFLDLRVLVGGIALALSVLVTWRLRRRPAVLLGVGWFLAALLPASQLVPNPVHRADRNLYLALVGLTVALAAVLRAAANAWPRRTAAVGLGGACLVAAILLGWTTNFQLGAWQTGRQTWENSLRVDPGNLLAGVALAAGDAAPRGEETLRPLDFDDPSAVGGASQVMGNLADEQGQGPKAGVLLAKRACELTGWEDPQYLGLLAGAYARLAAWRVDRGRFARAVEEYDYALRADPDHVPALFQLAAVLATCREPQVRNPLRAVELAERACARKERLEAGDLVVLAAAYASAWQFAQAAFATEKAIVLAEARGDWRLAADLKRRLELYRKRVPPE